MKFVTFSDDVDNLLSTMQTYSTRTCLPAEEKVVILETFRRAGYDLESGVRTKETLKWCKEFHQWIAIVLKRLHKCGEFDLFIRVSKALLHKHRRKCKSIYEKLELDRKHISSMKPFVAT